MSRRRLSQNPSVKSRSTIKPVESAMVKSSKIILFLKVPKDRRRQLAFKSRIELGLFANFVKKCSFKWLLWLKTGSHLREKGQIFFKNLRLVSVDKFPQKFKASPGSSYFLPCPGELQIFSKFKASPGRSKKSPKFKASPDGSQIFSNLKARNI